MSQSHRPTRAPVCSSAIARFAATVDFPTPPLPLPTAITCLTPEIRVVTVAAPAPPGGAWISIKTFVLRMPSIVRRARSASFLIVAGTFGSLVASASCTLTSPLSIWIDFTNPNETISRVKPGYFTAFNAFFTCSSEIDMHQITCAASQVNSARRFHLLRGAHGSRVGGRAVSITNFSGVQIHFAALLTKFGRGRRNCAHEPPALPRKESLRLAILLIHSVANLVIISGGKRAGCWSAWA